MKMSVLSFLTILTFLFWHHFEYSVDRNFNYSPANKYSIEFNYWRELESRSIQFNTQPPKKLFSQDKKKNALTHRIREQSSSSKNDSSRVSVRYIRRSIANYQHTADSNLSLEVRTNDGMIAVWRDKKKKRRDKEKKGRAARRLQSRHERGAVSITADRTNDARIPIVSPDPLPERAGRLTDTEKPRIHV